MPAIPTISRTEVPANQIGAVRIDPNAFSAQGRSLVAAGQAISQAAQVVGVIGQRRQAHVDRGLLANEETVRMNTAASVQEYMDQNQDKPETWSKFESDAWTGYEAGRDKRIREQAWTTRAADEDKIQYQAYKTQASIHFRTAQNKALIRKSNAQIEANADLFMKNGQVGEAIARINTLDLSPERKIEKVQQMTSAAAYHDFDRRLTDISEMAPVEQMKELASVEAELTAKDKKGGFVHGNIADEKGTVLGGLSEQGRIDLIRQTRARKNAALVDMSQTGRGLVRKVADGFAPEMVFAEALKAGQISEDVARIFLPEVDMALRLKAEKEAVKLEVAADRLGTQRDRAEVVARSEINRATGATLTLKDIERRQALGVTRPRDPTALTAEAADRLRAELQAAEAEDARTLDYTTIEDNLLKKLGQGVFTTYFGDKAQMSDEDRAKKLDAIHKTRISKGAKLKLLDLFFEVQKWDLREGAITDRDGDRNITPEEKDLRSGVIDSYRSMQSAMSARAIGARYMEDMNRIGDWFRQNPNASPALRAAKAKEFYDQTTKSVANDAAVSLLRSVYE